MSRICILIIEDDVIIAENIHDCLDSIDYEVSDIVYSNPASKTQTLPKTPTNPLTKIPSTSV